MNMTENLDKITIEDAIRLKNDLNKATQFDGCTAKEIADLERLNEEQYVTLHAEIAHIKQVWWTIPDWVMVVGSVAAILLAFWVDGFAERIVSILVACYCVAQVKYRQGVYYGFERGYQEGHLQGVHRVLGISKNESQEINELATQIEADERVIAKLDVNNRK